MTTTTEIRFAACGRHLRNSLTQYITGYADVRIRKIKGIDPLMKCSCGRYAQWYIFPIPTRDNPLPGLKR